MYSLTFRIHITTPHSMDEMERLTQQAHWCEGSLRWHA